MKIYAPIILVNLKMISKKSVRCLDDNYYKLLVYAVDVNGNNQSNSILNNAVVINKHINVNKFVEYLKYRLSIHENNFLLPPMRLLQPLSSNSRS